MDNKLALVEGMLKANAQIFQKTIDGIPAEQWLTQPEDGSNHMMWIAGHIVVHRAMISKMLGAEWSAPWEKLFVRGAKLVPAGEYPNPIEIRQAWKEVSEKLTDVLAEASADALGKPIPQGKPSLDGTIGGTVGFLCLHETYHVGQMGYLRKWLGHGQAVG